MATFSNQVRFSYVVEPLDRFITAPSHTSTQVAQEPSAALKILQDSCPLGKLYDSVEVLCCDKTEPTGIHKARVSTHRNQKSFSQVIPATKVSTIDLALERWAVFRRCLMTDCYCDPIHVREDVRRHGYRFGILLSIGRHLEHR